MFSGRSGDGAGCPEAGALSPAWGQVASVRTVASAFTGGSSRSVKAPRLVNADQRGYGALPSAVTVTVLG